MTDIVLTAEAARNSIPAATSERRARLEAEWRSAGWHRGVTLGDFLAEGAARNPETEILFHAAGRQTALTVRDIHDRGRHVAAALHRLGLRSGDTLAVQLPNWPETAVSYYAAAALGLILVPIVPIYGPAEVGFIVAQAQVRCLIVPGSYRRIDAERDVRLLREVVDLAHVIVVGSDAPPGTHSWNEFEAHVEEATFPQPPTDARAACVIIYTSGTTAEPKGVIHTHDSLTAELVSSPTPPPDTHGTVSLQPFPAGHTAGLSAILAPAYHGYTTLLLESFDARSCAELVQRYRVTAMAGTPFMISAVLDAAEQDGFDISSLVHGITGGGGVAPDLIRRADARGWRISRCYGATEFPSLTASQPTDSIDKRALTDGRPLAGNRVRIVDDAGMEVAVGEEGEIATVGPEQAVAYTNPAFTRAALLPDGWFLSGDIGRLDDDGYLTITDRKKDVIIRGGENISSREVEDVLISHPAVQDCAVVAVPDRRYGERVCAFVVLRAGESLDIERIRKHFEDVGVAKQKTPEILEIVAELPRTPVGKVRKAELRALALEGYVGASD